MLLIPRFFEGDNAQEQIEIHCHLISTSRPRCPYLRRNILDELRLPIMEPIPSAASFLPDLPGETTVETRVINANDGIRLSFDGQSVEFPEYSPVLKIM